VRLSGLSYPDDYQVIWRGLPIGRIMKQSRVQFGKQEWWFGCVAINSNSSAEITRLADIGRAFFDLESFLDFSLASAPSSRKR
jgi:hypothetical protein